MQAQRDAVEMQTEIRIGIAVAALVALGLLWSAASMSGWVPVTSANIANTGLATRH